jgi:phospholipase/carboxylesterase
VTDRFFSHVYHRPPGADRTTLLLLHGPTGDEHELLPLAGLIQPTAGILSARGQIDDGGTWRFFRRFPSGPADLGDLQRRAAQLSAFVAGAASRYKFDLREVVAVGVADGANLAATMMLAWPETLAGAALFRLAAPGMPPKMPKLPGTPVFLCNGRHDPVVTPEDTDEVAAVLRAAGATVTLSLQPGAQQLVAADVEAARAWFTACGTLRSPLRMS